MSTIRESTCPSDEQLAALLDGRLSGPERDQVEAHLAGCSRCYEVFKESAAVLDEVVAKPQPTSSPARPPAPEAPPEPARRGRLRRTFTLAAAVLGSVAGGVVIYRAVTAPSSVSTVALIAPLAGQEATLVGYLFEGRLRGSQPERALTHSVKLAVELGVRWVDLAVACRAGDSAAVRSAVTDVEDLWSRIRSALEGSGEAGLATSCQSLEHRERSLERALGHLAPDFSLGRWAEAGRLAAVARSGTFFAPGSAFRDELERIRGGPAQRIEVSRAAHSVSIVLDRPDRSDLGDGDFTALHEELDRLIRSYLS